MKNIFISYSHKDKKILNELQTCLKAVNLAGNKIVAWDDTRLKTGTAWEKDIRQAIKQAKLIVMIVSTDFLASDFITKKEIPSALKRAKLGKTRIMPLLATPTNLTIAKWLGKFQIKMPGGKALSQMKVAQRRETLNDFVEEIRQFLNAKKNATNSKLKKVKGSALKYRKSTHKYPSVTGGLLLIADICDFSDLPGEEQRKVINKLWKFFNEHDAIHKYRDVVNFFADRVMVAFPQHHNIVSFDDIVKFAEAMIDAMDEATLAVGIHQGNFERADVHGQIQAFGRGISDCEKLCRFGSHGSILISEDFIRAWTTEVGEEKIAPLVYPPPQNEPFTKLGKRQPDMQFRVYNTPKWNNKIPYRIAFGKVIHDQILQQLSSIETSFLAAVASIFPELTQSVISARVSLFAPTRMLDGNKCLCSTTLRFHFQGDVNLHGKTAYPINGKGHGPAGRAYVLNSPQIIFSLPEYEIQSAEYKDRLYKESELEQQITEGFGRKARSFIAFPFAIADASHIPDITWRPDGVICIDSLDPLNDFNQSQLIQIADELQRLFANQIAILWALFQRA